MYRRRVLVEKFFALRRQAGGPIGAHVKRCRVSDAGIKDNTTKIDLWGAIELVSSPALRGRASSSLQLMDGCQSCAVIGDPVVRAQNAERAKERENDPTDRGHLQREPLLMRAQQEDQCDRHEGKQIAVEQL